MEKPQTKHSVVIIPEKPVLTDLIKIGQGTPTPKKEEYIDPPSILIEPP